MAAGQERDATDNADSGAETCDSEKEEEQLGGGAAKRQVLVPRTQAIGEVPFDALVNPEQAESALGHTMSTEFDDDLLEMIDLDQRAEEEALLDRQVNPRHVDYLFLCWSPQDPQDISPSVVGWPSDMQPRQLQRQDFTCQKEEIHKKMKHGVTQLYTAFERQLATPEAGEALEAKVLSLDPTQLEAYKFVTEWAERQALTAQPHPLRLLMLGTAGTGKTHTAKSFITKVDQNLFILIHCFGGLFLWTMWAAASWDMFRRHQGKQNLDCFETQFCTYSFFVILCENCPRQGSGGQFYTYSFLSYFMKTVHTTCGLITNWENGTAAFEDQEFPPSLSHNVSCGKA